MDHAKIKILTMLEEGKINAYEALEILNAFQEDSESRSVTKMRRKGKKLSMRIVSGEKVKESNLDVNEVLLSAIMSRVNADLKHNGVNLSTEELKKVKDDLVSFNKVKIEKENVLIEISID